jgi:hypothetical protein
LYPENLLGVGPRETSVPDIAVGIIVPDRGDTLSYPSVGGFLVILTEAFPSWKEEEEASPNKHFCESSLNNR